MWFVVLCSVLVFILVIKFVLGVLKGCVVWMLIVVLIFLVVMFVFFVLYIFIVWIFLEVKLEKL